MVYVAVQSASHALYVLQMLVQSAHYAFCGPGSSVGITTGYGLDSPGIESRWGRDFSHTSRPALEPTQPPVQWVPGVKRPGRGADHPPPPSAEVENE
jgi:hypothetical protein